MKETVPDKLAKKFADLIMGTAHFTYNAKRGRVFVLKIISILYDRIEELKEKKGNTRI